MYKCNECGQGFEDYEESSAYEDRGFYGEGRAYERVYRRTCPHCGGEDFEKAYECKDCGDVFTEDEIFLPLCCCENCLKEHITLENFLEFAMDCETGLCEYQTYETIEDFMLIKVFGFPSTSFMNLSTLDFKRFLTKTYCDMAQDKKTRDRLLRLAKEYITSGVTECMDEFAEFLYYKEFEKCKKTS